MQHRETVVGWISLFAAVQLLKVLQQSWLRILLKDEADAFSPIRCTHCFLSAQSFGRRDQSAAAACDTAECSWRWAKLLGRFHLGIRK
jgi:hypothetical protein